MVGRLVDCPVGRSSFRPVGRLARVRRRTIGRSGDRSNVGLADRSIRLSPQALLLVRTSVRPIVRMSAWSIDRFDGRLKRASFRRRALSAVGRPSPLRSCGRRFANRSQGPSPALSVAPPVLPPPFRSPGWPSSTDCRLRPPRCQSFTRSCHVPIPYTRNPKPYTLR